MTGYHLRSRWQRLFHPRKPRRHAKGFTLMELLVAMLVGSIIIVALLTLVAQLTEANQRDFARTATQEDMQQALDYIGQDLREAAFVYDGTCLAGVGTPSTTNPGNCPGIVNHLPDAMTSTGSVTPVLAFWRVDPLPDKVATSCRALELSVGSSTAVDPWCISGRTYTLVVYGIDKANSNKWQGKARLSRWYLSQFKDDGTVNTEYVNPLGTITSRFPQWPYLRNDKTKAFDAPATMKPTGVKQVLVDFVDDGTPANTPACQTPSQITPTTATIRSFYACVRGDTQAARTDTTSASKEELAVNQEVLVVLQGNVSGRGGTTKVTANQLFATSPIQTRVAVRGVVNKQPR